MSKRMTPDHIETTMLRLEARLFRTVNALQKLRAMRKRKSAAAQVRPKPSVRGALSTGSAPSSGPERIAQLQPDSLDIPLALRRTPVATATAADEAAKAKLLDEAADLKRRKAAGAAARRKAQRAGDLRRMPLQGKEALAAIRSG